MKVKVKDIARAAGVSPTAVSLVLNEKPSRLSDATKEHILKIAREMQFQQNIGVSGEHKKVKTIGLLVPDLLNRVYLDMADEIGKQAARLGYTAFMCSVHESSEVSMESLQSLVTKGVDGLILIPPRDMVKDGKLTKMIKSIQDNGMPLLLLDRAVYSVFCDFVTSDNKQGGRLATEYLIRRGHRRIGCLLGSENVYTSRKRLEGYREALARNGLVYEDSLVVYGDFEKESGREGAGKLLGNNIPGEPVTAVFAASDQMAAGIYEYAGEKGISIPDQLSVIGFDDSPVCGCLKPELTSIRQCSREMGGKAVDLLAAKIEGVLEDPASRNFYFSPLLVERASVRSLRQESLMGRRV